MRLPVILIQVDDAEGTGRHAVAAAVADVLLHHHGVELGLEDRAGRAGLQAGRVVAMLADVAHHQPAGLEGRLRGAADARAAALARVLLDEGHMPPGIGRERAGIVVALAGQAQIAGRQVVPFLAGHLAGLAADAHRRVGEEALARGRVDVAGVGRRVVEPAEQLAHQESPSLVLSGWMPARSR